MAKMKFILNALLIALTYTNIVYNVNGQEEAAYNITSQLLANYDKKALPTDLVIKLKINLNHIISIDEINQIMQTSSIIEIQWTDKRLQFTNESGLQEILIPALSIWLPDLFVINTADKNGFVNIFSENLAAIDNSGNIRLTISLSEISTRCSMDYFKFPYDSQVCQIQIGSWQLDNTRVDFDSDDSDINYLNALANNVWKLDKITSQDRIVTARLSPGLNATDIIYNLFLTRRPVNFMINNVFPIFIVNGVSLLAYFFPYPQQCIISLSSFLTLAIYSIRIAGEYPAQSEYIPLVSIYFMLGILYIFISLIWHVTREQLTLRADLPEWLIKFGNGVRHIYFCCKTTRIEKTKTKSVVKTSVVKIIDKSKQDLKLEETSKKQAVCFKCDECDKCKEDKVKEDAKKKKKKEKEAIIKSLNFLALTFMILNYFVSYLTVWGLISS